MMYRQQKHMNFMGRRATSNRRFLKALIKAAYPKVNITNLERVMESEGIEPDQAPEKQNKKVDDGDWYDELMCAT